MELRQLEYFVTVVEERSVSRAAARLHMTQPPLSTAMQQLEREIGVPLLRRHARGVEPTDAGRYLADEARRTLRRLADAAVRARAVGTGQTGRLTIAAEAIVSWHVLPSVLRGFRRRSPDVALDLTDAAPDDVVQRVRDSRAAVGLVYCADSATLARSVAAGLQTAVVRREPLVAVLPAGHPRAVAGELDLRELAEDPWVVPVGRGSAGGLEDVLRQAWRATGMAPHDQRSSATPVGALALVASGHGVTLLPTSVNAVAGADVRIVPVRQAVPPLEAAAVWRNEPPSPVLAAFLAAALATPEPDQLERAPRREPPEAGSVAAEPPLPRRG